MILLYSSFWPGSLFYMLTVLPVIWVAELKVLNEKIAGGTQACEITTQNTVATLGNGLVCSLRLRSHGTGRIFNRLKHLTGYFTHTGPCNVFALFALKWKPGLILTSVSGFTICPCAERYRLPAELPRIHVTTPLPCKNLDGQGVHTAQVKFRPCRPKIRPRIWRSNF